MIYMYRTKTILILTFNWHIPFCCNYINNSRP